MIYTFEQLLARLDAAKAFPQEATTAEKKEITNEALEAIIVSGRWDGTEVQISINVGGSGIMTLPRELASCKGIRVGGNVRQLASIWYTYLSGTSDLSQWSTNIQDLGDRRCTFADMRPSATQLAPAESEFIPEPAQLRIACASETSPPFVEVHGLDADGKDIWVGSQHGVQLSYNASKTGPFFARLKEVILTVTDEPATLYACYADGSEDQIGWYEPGETMPMYRGYLIQEAQTNVAGSIPTAVNALCQRRHVDLIADNDVCQISNFKAILYSVRAIHWSREGDETRQKEDFEECISLLNSEFKRQKPPTEIGAMRVVSPFSCATGLYSRR